MKHLTILAVAIMSVAAAWQNPPKESPIFNSKEHGFSMAYPSKSKDWSWTSPKEGQTFAAECEHDDGATLHVYVQAWDPKETGVYSPENHVKQFEESARKDFKTVKQKGVDKVSFGADKADARRLTLHVGQDKDIEQVREYYCFQSNRNRSIYSVVVFAAPGVLDGDGKKAKELRRDVDAVLGSFRSFAPTPPKKP